MPAFSYLAIDRKGREKKGVLEADSERQIRQQLREMNLFPMEVRLIKERSFDVKHMKHWYQDLFQNRLKQAKIKTHDLALVTRQLASLLSAGLPIEEALLGVAEQSERPTVKSVFMGVRSQLLEGRTLAQAMDDFPGVFPHLYRAAVRSGEKAGELDQVLNRLADYVEKQYQVQKKISHALIYPSLLILVSIAILIFLLVYIVPKIVDVFSESEQSLPFATILLLNISYFLKNYGIYLFIGMLISIVGFQRLLRMKTFKYRFHQFLMRLPVFGRLIKTVNSARFSRTFGILFAASVPVLEAMQAATEVITLLPMQLAVSQAVLKVGEGLDIYRSLKQTGYFSPISLSLIAVGESTGSLEGMLERSADQQDQDVALFIESALTLFEPLMILVMGGMVLFIVLAVLLPIFNLDVLVK